MLSLLHIENIAVISQAEISFERGFNVLTGETGAGKSIVIDSIGAIIGERTSRDLIRTGAKSARVSGVFRELPALPWFEEQDIFPDENGELLVERTIQPDGKNNCRVNGRPILVTQLRELGCQLLNIHGQHDGQQLLNEECHLSYLDSFGGTGPELEKFRTLYGKLQSIRDALRSLQMDESEKARKIDTLQFQIGELERAELRSGEEEELTARRDILRNGERLTEAISGAWQALTGGDDGAGAVPLLTTAQESLASGGRYSEELSKLSEQASELKYALDDLAERVRDLEASLDFYPGELDELESRLDVIYRLKRKYGDSVDEMLSYLERCRNELDEIQFSEDRVKQLEGEFSKALTEAKKQGAVLSAKRRQAAEELAQRIRSELNQLDMPKVQFQVEFSEKPSENGMDDTGMDEVRFLMSANAGEALKPIQKIASGGELARIMLALKNVLAENDAVTTMVFDEVDTGVSGRAAQKVAEKLYSVARDRQVLCVTHLPQIAAMGDVHFSVTKGETEGRTFTVVERMSREGRKRELARLTSGDHVTEVALSGAEEMLSAAEQWKQSR
jgi:DNA repair protein RecN (Recombination protein N)